MYKILLTIVLSLSSLAAYSEARFGIPHKVMLVNATKVPSLWIYIDSNKDASCASNGIIKLATDDGYSDDEIKMWTSLALTAFTAGKTLRVWYSDAAIETGTCSVTNIAIEH